MAYLDKNGLNYYSQKVSGKIQDVKDDLDELKIIEEEESEVIDIQWNTGTGVWTHFNNQFEFLWGDGSTNPISVNSGEKYFISTYTDASDTPAVILVNNSERYSHGIIEDQYIIATYGNSSLYEGIITIPQNVEQMIVNNINDNYTPIIKKITKEGVKVEKLADANFTTKSYVDGEISTINTALSGKQSTLTFDSTPTANSTNPVTSGGIKTALDNKETAINNVEVSGTSPVIVAESNTIYNCGEVTSLSFTPCASGICDVRFTSGSTVTVLTIPSTVKFPNSFDPTSLETNKIYEINILDGIYGVVTSWAI